MSGMSLSEDIIKEEREVAARFEGDPTFRRALRDFVSIYGLRLEIIDELDQGRFPGEHLSSMNGQLAVNLLRGVFNSTLGRVFKKTI